MDNESDDTEDELTRAEWGEWEGWESRVLWSSAVELQSSQLGFQVGLAKREPSTVAYLTINFPCNSALEHFEFACVEIKQVWLYFTLENVQYATMDWLREYVSLHVFVSHLLYMLGMISTSVGPSWYLASYALSTQVNSAWPYFNQPFSVLLPGCVCLQVCVR